MRCNACIEIEGRQTDVFGFAFEYHDDDYHQRNGDRQNLQPCPVVLEKFAHTVEESAVVYAKHPRVSTLSQFLERSCGAGCIAISEPT